MQFFTIELELGLEPESSTVTVTSAVQARCMPLHCHHLELHGIDGTSHSIFLTKRLNPLISIGVVPSFRYYTNEQTTLNIRIYRHIRVFYITFFIFSSEEQLLMLMHQTIRLTVPQA